MDISLTYRKQTSNNISLRLFLILTIGIISTIGIIYLTSSKTINSPISIPIDYVTTDGVNTTFNNGFIVLFRGVHALHPDLPNAKVGIAMPIGGHSDPELHNMGDNKSVFTSWTTNIWVANSFACRKGSGGIILVKQFHITQLVPSTGNFQQGEWLVSGIVVGAVPLHTFDINIPVK